MTKFKTNEEYILNELYKAQEELQLANKKIEELEEKLKNDDTNEENMNCIYLSDKPNYWYSFSIQGTYNWNKILKDNKKTPKLVEKALTDDKALKQLCKLKENEYMKHIAKDFEQLQQENKQLKEKIKKTIRMLEIQIEAIKVQPSDNALNDNMEIKQREMVINLLNGASE